MAAAPPGTVLRYLRGLAVADQARHLSDAHLLRRFAERREEDVFAALVERHGRLVWAVCRHVLGDDHDADDAFQATFVILAHKADTIRDGAALAGWLQATAYRVALRARRDAAIRRRHERRGQPMPAEKAIPESVLREALALLDEEVERLPARQRAAFVLCCLEGKGLAEAARQLGWKEGTVSGTLSRARQRLRQRLTRRGVTLSSVLTALALNGAAALPAGTARTTAQAVLQPVSEGAETSTVAALAAGVMKGMAQTRARAVTAVFLAFSLAALGAGLLACPGGGETQPQATTTRMAEASRRVDQFGDPLPPGALARLGTVRFRHGARIYSVDISPDGKTLASRGLDGAVRLWEVGSGKELARFDLSEPGDWTNTVAFSPDGKLLATATKAAGLVNMILIWDVANRKQARRIDVQDATRRVSAVAFADGGKTLAGVFGQTVLLWDATTGREVRRLQGHQAEIEVLTVSPDGKTLATGGRDGTVRLWDLATGRERSQFPRKLALRPDVQHHPMLPPVKQRGVLSLAFSPDGKLLALAVGGEKIFRVWDTEANRELPAFAGDAGEVSAVAFLPDGKTLVSGAWNGILHLWDVPGRKEIRQFQGQQSPVLSLALSRDGMMLAVGGYRTVRLWEPSGSRELRPLPGHHEGIMRIEFSPDGKTVATGVGSWDQSVYLWDAATGKERRRLQAPTGNIDLLMFSADGKTLGIGSGWDLTIRTVEMATGRKLSSRHFNSAGGGRFLWSPGGRVVAGTHGQRHLMLWDTVTGKVTHTASPPLWSGIAVSPDGKLVAADSPMKDGTIILRDAQSGKELRSCQGYPRSLSAFVFSPDGKYLAGAFHSSPRVVVVWDVATGQKVAECRAGDRDTTYMALAFSPDGKTLTSGGSGGRVRLWEVATAGERRSFRGHLSAVRVLGFSPDGRRLASGGEDTLGIVWDLADPGSPKRDGETLWADLASTDAAVAYRASRGLIGMGGKGVALIAQHLKPVAAVEAKRLAKLLTGLDSNQFAVRQRATQELEALADAAEPALRNLLEKGASLEVRRRVQGLLNKQVLPRSPGRLRQFRAVETLEFLAARRLLERLAGGVPEAFLTREARASLNRLREVEPRPSRSAEQNAP
jgi:RNA polymerase sigma factor (sigma-70 family)